MLPGRSAREKTKKRRDSVSEEGNTGRKIHCAVCGRTFDAAADKCPNCSAPASLSQTVAEPREEKREPVFVCTICGHTYDGDAAPERCENCGVGGELIEERRPAPTRTWICTVCGLKIKGENAPGKCPKCESPAELFAAQKDGIARMRCSICGFETEGDTAPERCENCGVDGELFEPVKN